jgi:hypothetical protein
MLDAFESKAHGSVFNSPNCVNRNRLDERKDQRNQRDSSKKAASKIDMLLRQRNQLCCQQKIQNSATGD